MTVIKMYNNEETLLSEHFVGDIFDTSLEEIKDKHVFPQAEIELLKRSVLHRGSARPEIEEDEVYELALGEVNDRITEDSPSYFTLSSRIVLRQLQKRVAKNRGYNFGQEYQNYADFVSKMVRMGIYDPFFVEKYTREELEEVGKLLDPEKDKLFSYAGLFLLRKNYLAKKIDTFNPIHTDEFPMAKVDATLELPQERFMAVILDLLQDEDLDVRMDHIKEAYWSASNHYIGFATPTLTNGGRLNGTLSSCHILTLDDSLRSIFSVLDDTGTFSQNGAGIGIYAGNLRAAGSWIRNYPGRATGIIGPTKLFNEVVNYVDQLNQRKGGIAVYLDVDHLDVFDFLDLKLHTGSQTRRAHDIFTGLNIPDEFMRRLRDRGDWTMFDPYEIRNRLGFDLHSMFDKVRLEDGEEPNPELHAYTYHYRLAEQSDLLELKRTVPISKVYEAIYNARKMTGVPYIYFSDTAARENPNSHKGKPYSSNLCSEIIQNQSPDVFVQIDNKGLDFETGVVTVQKYSDGLVTCNLSSVVLPNVYRDGVSLQRVTDIQFRMLDNVISLSRVDVPQATFTSNKYRSVGSGTIGLATLIAENEIHWDSDEAIEFADKLFEDFAFACISSSQKLAEEKGAYPYFEGSQWHTGEYFERKGYNSPRWLELKEKVAEKGIRNGYLMAHAPTASNSIIMNASSGTQAMFDVVYMNKKEKMNVTIVPPNYNFVTKQYYKSAFAMDEVWSIMIAAAVTKHTDQGVSHDLQLPRDTGGRALFRVDYAAWENGLKSIYYTHTRKIDASMREGCVMCEG